SGSPCRRVAKVHCSRSRFVEILVVQRLNQRSDGLGARITERRRRELDFGADAQTSQSHSAPSVQTAPRLFTAPQKARITFETAVEPSSSDSKPINTPAGLP